MAIYFGSDKIKEIYVGSDKIKEVYHGSDLVWSGSKPSYLIKTDGTRIDFELENTPIANFCTDTPPPYGRTTVNRISILKADIKEVFFGNSYEGITIIPADFMAFLTSVISVNLKALKNLDRIGNYFMRNTTALFDISLGVSTPPLLGLNSFYQNGDSFNIIVPMQSVQAYKTAYRWLTHASKIQGY